MLSCLREKENFYDFRFRSEKLLLAYWLHHANASLITSSKFIDIEIKNSSSQSSRLHGHTREKMLQFRSWRCIIIVPVHYTLDNHSHCSGFMSTFIVEIDFDSENLLILLGDERR